MVSLQAVYHLKAILPLLLVALWLPASSHALLQHLGFIHHHHEHEDHAEDCHEPDSSDSHEHGTANHDAADGLCHSPAGKVQVPTPAFVMVPEWFAVMLVAPLTGANLAAQHSGLSPPGVAPPELSHRWQFSFRAALPARAPSLAS